MNRRNVLLGLGTAAAGSGIVFGSGAFTQVQADRDVTIGISEDSNSLLALKAGDVSSVGSADGELYIDTDELSSGNEGFNVGSTVLIGETEGDIIDREPNEAEVVADITSNSSQTGAAFKLTNNIENTADSSDQIDLAVNLEDFDDGDGELTFIISEYEDGGSRGDSADASYIASSGGQVIINNLTSGDELYFAIEIETDSTTSPKDFNGKATFRAGPDLGGSGFPTDAEALGEIVNVTQNVALGNDTIQEAIDGDGNTSNYDGANAGDLIQVHGGSFEESVTVDVEDITLESAEGATATVSPAESNGRTNTITASAKGVTIRGLTVEATGGSTPRGIVLDADETAAIDNDVSHVGGTDSGPLIAVQDGDGVTVDGNDVTDGPIAYVGGNSNQVAFTDNTVTSDSDLVDEAFFAFSGTDPVITLTGNDFSSASAGSGDATVKFDNDATVNDQTEDAAIATSVIDNNTGVEDVQGNDGTTRSS